MTAIVEQKEHDTELFVQMERERAEHGTNGNEENERKPGP